MKGSHSFWIIAFSILSFVSITVQASTTVWGDINGDGEVSIVDILLATKSVLGDITLSNEQLSRGNVAPLVNGMPQPLDPYEALNAGDLLLILQIASGINKAPAFSSGPQNVSIIHGHTNTAYVANATDINNDDLSYSISGGVDANLFEINSLTGELIFSAAPNYYFPDDNDKNNTYQLELMVTDGQFTSTMELLINIDRPINQNEEKVVNWFNNLQLANGLLESSENSNFVSLYDQALSALVFLSRGNIENAEMLFDFFNDRIDTELLVGNGGFSQFRNRVGTPNNHRWMGDNAWLLIALNTYKSLTGENTYDRLAAELENWLRSLQDSDGGLWGGYDASGGRIPKITEGNIDTYNAVPGYDEFHSNLLQYFENELWDSTDKNLVAWPGNSQYLYALDLHSWSYLIFEDYPISSLTSADRFLTTQRASAINQDIIGYCFDIDRDVVWLEGTGEMIVAFNLAGMEDEASFYLGEMEKMILDSELFGGSAGIPYATNPGTGYGAGALWEGVDLNPAISSSAWYLFGKNQFNPFGVGRNKNVPTSAKFWSVDG